MDTLDMAKSLKDAMQPKPVTGVQSSKSTIIFGTARSDSINGYVDVDLGGETIGYRDTSYASLPTNVAVKNGNSVMVQLIGEDGTGKQPCVVGVQGGGDIARDNTDEARKVATNYLSTTDGTITLSNQNDDTYPSIRLAPTRIEMGNNVPTGVTGTNIYLAGNKYHRHWAGTVAVHGLSGQGNYAGFGYLTDLTGGQYTGSSFLVAVTAQNGDYLAQPSVHVNAVKTRASDGWCEAIFSSNIEGSVRINWTITEVV